MQDALPIGTDTDEKTGLPIYSLYGETRVPTEDMLSEIDTMVSDLQDVGARFYTYIHSMAYAMQACAKAGKRFVVLDRINPIGGNVVRGTMLDEAFHSFVGEYAVPTRYALTIGEFALFVKERLSLDLDLAVVPLSGWKREMLWRDTDAVWTPPSPNMPTPETALVYTGTCIFEGTNLSEGRGTTTPFSLIGAPYIDADKLKARMDRQGLQGMGFLPARFVPTFSKWEGEACHGLRIFCLRPDCDVFETGLILLETVFDMYPNEAQFLDGTDATLARLLGTDDFPRKKDARTLIREHAEKTREFARLKKRYHLY